MKISKLAKMSINCSDRTIIQSFYLTLVLQIFFQVYSQHKIFKQGTNPEKLSAHRFLLITR